MDKKVISWVYVNNSCLEGWSFYKFTVDKFQADIYYNIWDYILEGNHSAAMSKNPSIRRPQRGSGEKPRYTYYIGLSNDKDSLYIKLKFGEIIKKCYMVPSHVRFVMCQESEELVDDQ